MSEQTDEADGVEAEGEASFRRGLPRQNCPYPPGAIEREQWLAGFDRAAASPV